MTIPEDLAKYTFMKDTVLGHIGSATYVDLYVQNSGVPGRERVRVLGASSCGNPDARA